jgi:hypothetical protein
MIDNKYESLPGSIAKNIEFDMKGACFSVYFLPGMDVSRTSCNVVFLISRFPVTFQSELNDDNLCRDPEYIHYRNVPATFGGFEESVKLI